MFLSLTLQSLFSAHAQCQTHRQPCSEEKGDNLFEGKTFQHFEWNDNRGQHQSRKETVGRIMLFIQQIDE